MRKFVYKIFHFRHLPANLIASFAKRLARLSLLVPQHDQCLVITFIYNLIIRHPTIRVMIDRKQSSSISIKADVYLAEELDPNKTNAIESSLWEIEVQKPTEHLYYNFNFFFL